MRGIYLIRHSNTTYDDKVDALLNPPLDEEGAERVKRTLGFLKGIDFRRVISSPLQRCLSIAERLGGSVTTNNACLPWNLGDIMGKPTKLVQSKIDYLENYPDIKAPHGESYRTFHLRWEGFLWKVMDYCEAHPEEPVAVVTHSRNINDLQSIIDGNPVGDVQLLTPEASVTLLAKNGVSWEYQIIWEGK